MVATTAPAQSDRVRVRTTFAVALIAIPAIIFYAILFRLGNDLPDQDDYGALLDFLNKMAVHQGFFAKTSYFFAAQYKEYKLFFEHALVFAQFAVLGHIEFRFLCAIGNGFVLLIAILLWKMFLPGCKDRATRLMFFIPVTWLIFQLQYVETLDWAMASLQNLPVIVFSLGAIYLLVRGTRRTYCEALGCLVLAIGSSANGVLIAPIGAVILARTGKFPRLMTWLAVSAMCACTYAYRYHVLPPESLNHHSMLWQVIHAGPLFLVSFLGGAAAFPVRGGYYLADVLLCPLIGLILCAFLIAMVQRGYFRKNPSIGYCVIFLLSSGLLVAVGRSNFDISKSFVPRYGIYSTLLLVFAWFAAVEEFILPNSKRGLVLACGVVLAVFFSLRMDTFGRQYLMDRKREIAKGMMAFEHSGQGPVLPTPHQTKRIDELDRTARVVLKGSMRLGIYVPPDDLSLATTHSYAPIR
jgi:hypothetical protein